jgi:hypothetical protein
MNLKYVHWGLGDVLYLVLHSNPFGDSEKENQRQRQNGQFEQGGSNIMQISSMPTGPESGMFMDNPNVSPNQVEKA